MALIVQGQQFPTLQDFKDALREWALERRFTPAILDSDSHRVRAGCRSSPNCPFRIRANYNEKKGYARVTTCDDVHNCVSTSDHHVSQDVRRPEASRLKFLVDAVPKLITVDKDTPTTTIIEAVKRKYGQKIALRQAQKVKQMLVPKIRGPCRHCRQMGHSKRQCPRRHEAPVPAGPDEDENGGSFGDTTAGIQIESDDGGMPGLEGLRCSPCSQPGHRQQNCDNSNSNSISNDALRNHPGANTGLQASSHAVNTRGFISNLDPNLTSGIQAANPGTHSALQADVIPTTTVTAANQIMTNGRDRLLRSGPAPASNVEYQLGKTPQEVRLEAAKLMQQAARHMQEAAKLNFEAAKLTASLAKS